MTDDRIYLAALERALKRRGLDEFRTAEVIREMSNHVADEMEILAELGCDGWELTGVRDSGLHANATPDELLISAIGPQDEYETQYIRRSTLTAARCDGPDSAADRTPDRRARDHQERFKIIYGAQADPAFAMDVEFKIDAAGDLAVKQAGPWVD